MDDSKAGLSAHGDETPQSGAERETTVVPVIAEELLVRKRKVPTGGIRVTKTVHDHEELIAMPLLKEKVDIRRVIIGRDVDGPLPIRREGETTIIPVVEEVIVVEKRMRLKEELHITRRTTEEHSEQKVIVQREEAIIERLDSQGHAVPEEVPVHEAPVQKLPLKSGRPQNAYDLPRSKAHPVRRNKVIPEE